MTVLADPGRSAAVLVGVHDYLHLEGLPAVERNLAGLRRVLTDPGVWGLAPEDCPVIAQPGDVRAVLDVVRQKARETTDTLLVYYAGHGLTDEYSEELYLALPDTDREREYTALRYESLRRAVLDPQARAQRTVVVLDCCYSGRALVGGMSAGDHLADRTVVNGTVVLTASASTRPALSPPGELYTAFTGELIDLLERGVPGGPELLDMDTLYRRLHERLAAKSRPLPQQRNRNTGGLIAIARNQAAAVPVARAGAPTEPEPEPEPAAPVTESEPKRWVAEEAERLRRAAEAAAQELLVRATGLAAALAARPDQAFRPYWLAVPEARRLFGSDGSLEPVGELLPGTWHLAVQSRGDALLVELPDRTQGLLLDTAGLERGEYRGEGPPEGDEGFEPYWFAVPTRRPLAAPAGSAPDGSAAPTGELVPGTWYLAVESRGGALLVQLPYGTKGLLFDTAGLERGEYRGEGPPEGDEGFEPYWFAVPVPRQLIGLEAPMEPVARLAPGSWYLAVAARGDALVVQLPTGVSGLLRETAGIERGV
ncbi:caspase domain-containing protein [Kitasatospora sp. SUK 42]|uniref:caspase family protein n=1 Tax=Kitasatospora sp. SUK 42 TaxID=1588882 RepID=UPI0018C95394|nr:caspase family protein [Kitasatospora sp. SUK 42]MBV2152203.1 caspase family protein [Kitasatospora sp. SUK 42]